MKCVRKITEDLYYIGGSDRRMALFENCYPIPNGMTYNSYLLLDEKTVLFDTVDYAVGRGFMENLTSVLGGRKLDYLIINHMEPDHCALIPEIISRYPDMKLVLNKKTLSLISQFYNEDRTEHSVIVGEGDTFSTGKHEFKFIMAPMVHWPEVMMTYDMTDKILFSADAFGTFGALDGRIFNDEMDCKHEFVDEMRRYYSNIVGKYGAQVQAVFKKAPEDIKTVCPLHGPIWRTDIEFLFEKYKAWSSYMPEEKGVLIAYASMYGDTELACQVLSMKLADRGIKNMMVADVSNVHFSYLISGMFKYSTAVFACPTYNASIHPNMATFFHEMKELTVRNRAYVLIENGSWASMAGKCMKAELDSMKNMTQIGETVVIKSALLDEQEAMLDELADKLAEEIKKE